MNMVQQLYCVRISGSKTIPPNLRFVSNVCLFCLDVLVEQVAKYKEQFIQAVQEVA